MSVLIVHVIIAVTWKLWCFHVEIVLFVECLGWVMRLALNTDGPSNVCGIDIGLCCCRMAATRNPTHWNYGAHIDYSAWLRSLGSWWTWGKVPDYITAPGGGCWTAAIHRNINKRYWSPCTWVVSWCWWPEFTDPTGSFGVVALSRLFVWLGMNNMRHCKLIDKPWLMSSPCCWLV